MNADTYTELIQQEAEARAAANADALRIIRRIVGPGEGSDCGSLDTIRAALTAAGH